MLGIGIGEMLLIAGIALIVIGPEKFPDFAKIALRTIRDLRGYVDDIQGEISKEIKPIKRELDQLKKYDPEKYIDAIAGDTPKTKTNQPTAPPGENKGAADPTDRQDDSFDYEPADAAPVNEDPYGHDKQVDETHASDTEASPPDTTKSSTQTEAEDDFNFTEPPVERMD